MNRRTSNAPLQEQGSITMLNVSTSALVALRAHTADPKAEGSAVRVFMSGFG